MDRQIKLTPFSSVVLNHSQGNNNLRMLRTMVKTLLLLVKRNLLETTCDKEYSTDERTLVDRGKTLSTGSVIEIKWSFNCKSSF